MSMVLFYVWFLFISFHIFFSIFSWNMYIVTLIIDNLTLSWRRSLSYRNQLILLIHLSFSIYIMKNIAKVIQVAFFNNCPRPYISLYPFLVYFMIIWDALRNFYHLYNLKVAGFTKSNTPPWVFFTFFKLHKWYQIA